MNNEDKKYLADVLKEHEEKLYKMIKEQHIDGLEADSDYYDNFIKETKAKLEEFSEMVNDCCDKTKCEHQMITDISIKLVSDPPKYKTTCKKCGFITYILEDQIDSLTAINSSKVKPRCSIIECMKELIIKGYIDYDSDKEEIYFIASNEIINETLEKQLKYLKVKYNKYFSKEGFWKIIVPLSQWD